MKEKNIKAAWFLPFRYIAPADLENYYEQMDASGWHVDKISQINSFCTKFKRSEPQKNRYVVDLHAKFKTKEYIETYKSFGWELVGQMASMYVWRKPYTEERPEAFSDTASVNKRSDNFLRVLLFMNIFLIAVAVAMTVLFFVFEGWQTADGIISYSVNLGIMVCLIALLTYARYKIRKNRHR